MNSHLNSERHNAESLQQLADAALEREIEASYQAGVKAAASDLELAREYFAAMAELISRRTPEKIRELEKARGLR